MDAGLLLARITLGVLMAAHGSQKLLGWFGGYGLAGTAGFFEALGFRPGRLFATAAAVTEVVSGLLLAIGLFGPVPGALMVSVMIVAALTLTGPGAYSLDALIGLTPLWTPEVTWAALAIGIVGGVANLALRRLAPAPVAP